MHLIHKTVSLCNQCYKHIPAVVYENDNMILMAKNCPQHGIQHSTVETDTEFYYNLEHRKHYPFSAILFEVTDRCQLTCPHCYHLPDNKVKDRSISDIITQLKLFDKSSNPMIAGAEATLRPDFIELCQEINKLGFNEFELLTNGLKFDNEKWSRDVFDTGLKIICLGLNHPSYQGQKVHDKQLRALKNMIEHGFSIGYVGYTIESYDHLPFILDEIAKINHPQIDQFRIRCGSFIGRSSDKHRSHLSQLVKQISLLGKGNIECYPIDDNPYHKMLSWNGILLRIIQWPDVTNIDMEELSTGPWCQFYDGPITNFVHQVITRDAYKNMNLPQLDLVPSKYQYRTADNLHHHWRDNWQGKQHFNNFDWSLDSDQMPKKITKFYARKF